MKYLSLFTGIGGFEKGIEQAYEIILNRHQASEEQQAADSGVRRGNVHLGSELLQGTPTCIGYSEIDKYATQIYQKHFPEHHNYGDITKIIASELPDFDLLVGGFPCQAFSIAGKRRGFDDTRGTLFFEISRIIKYKKPKYFVLENVKGLLSHDGGRTLGTIFVTLDELGYDFQWQVLNSKNFGVPQNRERVFIVGHLRGSARPEVFPFGFNGGEDIGQRKPVFSTVRATYPGNWNGDYVDTDTEYRQTQEKFSELKIRRLTPTECERLQGFEDGWTEGVSDSQRYKCLGNAVTVNVIQAIMERLITTT